MSRPRPRSPAASGSPALALCIALLLALAAACGDDGNDPPGDDADGTDVGELDGTEPDGTDDADASPGCDLGIPSSGTIIEYGSAQDYLVEFANPEEGVTLAIARLYDGAGVGESKLFALGGFALDYEGGPVCITDAAALDYENSHHNWADIATATAGASRFVLDLRYDFSGTEPRWVYTL